jgi:hypothetical protein
VTRAALGPDLGDSSNIQMAIAFWEMWITSLLEHFGFSY